MFLAPATPMFSFVHEHSGGLFVSAAVHGVLLLALSVSLMSVPQRIDVPMQLAIEATVIDEGAIRRANEERDREARAEQQRIDEQRRQEAAEQKRRDQQAEKERQARAEQQRKETEAARRQEEEAQERREQAEKERLAKIEEDRRAEELQRQQAEEARLTAQREAELRAALEAEERLLAAEQSGLLAQYIAVIRQRVQRNWTRPASATPDLECVLHVNQIPGGEVVGVRVGECNGDEVVIRSIEAAVYRSSPLPVPPAPELFERNLRFTFKPEQ